jgi:IMP dehydrogenase/GMP reductase
LIIVDSFKIESIKDGGCVCPGDVAKAFGAGADFVMLGGMLSGHDECAGDTVEQDNKKFKIFYGELFLVFQSKIVNY